MLVFIHVCMMHSGVSAFPVNCLVHNQTKAEGSAAGSPPEWQNRLPPSSSIGVTCDTGLG